jgi:hypothetical protein
MVLYNLCPKPFLNMMEHYFLAFMFSEGKPPGPSCGLRRQYDNFLTSVTYLKEVEDDIPLFERASRVRVNPNKSRAVPIKNWSSFETVLGIIYCPSVKILGVQFWSTIQRAVTATWTCLTGKVYTVPRKSYPRDLCLAHRIRYVHKYLVVNIWYVAHIIPVSSTTILHLTAAVTYFNWRGNFSVTRCYPSCT